MSSEKDIYTFEFGEVKKGPTYALAMSRVTENFVQSNFGSSTQYQPLLLAILQGLSADPNTTVPMLHALEKALGARQGAILQEQRDNDKDRRKYKGERQVMGADPNASESDDEDVPLTEEEEAAQKAHREAEEKRKLEEYVRAQERYEAMQRQKEENEALLKSNARQVDSKAFEEQLKSRGAVLVNPGSAQKKKPTKPGQLSAEEAAKLKDEVDQVTKERYRLDAVLHTSDEEIPAAMEEAKKAIADYESRAKNIKEGAAGEGKEMSKGEVSQLQQKLAKQTLDKNRFALQLKAMEPNPQRDELLVLLETRDALAIKVERAGL